MGICNSCFQNEDEEEEDDEVEEEEEEENEKENINENENEKKPLLNKVDLETAIEVEEPEERVTKIMSEDDSARLERQFEKKEKLKKTQINNIESLKKGSKKKNYFNNFIRLK